MPYSPILLAMPEAEILNFNDGELHACSYEETDSYRIYEMFIRNRQLVLKHLFEDENKGES